MMKLRSRTRESKPFDFSKDLDLLIHVFLSLAFATTEELGWDSTIRPFIRDDGGRPLHAVRDLEDVFTVLSDSAKILKWIHGAGWVHRDLSVGNLYLYQCRGLIGDLEYAKRKKSDLDNEVQTGTPDFMAVEAAKRCYIHLTPVGADQLKAELAALLEGRVEYLQKMMDSRIPPPFFHNDLHDLESLWWIAVWALFNNHIVPMSGIVCSQTEEQDFQRESVAAELFSENNAAESRRLFIQAMDDYYNQVAWMPECLRSVKILLDSLRTELVLSYRKFEASFISTTTEVCDGVQDEFQRLFASCRDASAGMKVMPYKKLSQRLRGSRRDTVNRAILKSRAQPDDQLSDNKVIPRPKADEKGLHLRSEPARERSVQKRKRKRDDDDDSIVSVRPRRMARHGIKVF
ncbi:hypothetical protein ACEPAH_2589 [Sanghuangporus vaninii]